MSENEVGPVEALIYDRLTHMAPGDALDIVAHDLARDIEKVTLTDRDLELIEIVLESAVSVCGAPLGPPDPDLDDLAQEYQAALNRVRERASK